MLIDHTEVLHTFPVTIDFFILLQLFHCQVPKELSKPSTLPFTRGKIHEGTCPVGRKINPDFPVSKASFYSATVAVIKPGYIWNIQHITENVKFFSKPIQRSKMRFVRRMSMGMSLFRHPLSHQTWKSHCKFIHTAQAVIQHKGIMKFKKISLVRFY